MDLEGTFKVSEEPKSGSKGSIHGLSLGNGE